MTREEYRFTDSALRLSERKRLEWQIFAVMALAGCVFWFGAWLFSVAHWGIK